MLQWLGAIFLVYTPAYIANMMPVLAAAWKWPGGRAISVEYFGDHKTYRGFYSGVLGGALGAFGLWYLELGPIGSKNLDVALILGSLMGFGALLGDLIKSGVKRRFNIRPGGAFFPFDQVDFIVGATLFAVPVMEIPVQTFVLALLVTPLLHLGTNILAWKWGLKQEWW